MEIALAFMASPLTEADTSCIEASVEPRWVPASLEGIGFEPFAESQPGITGVFPQGWEQQGFGISVRNDTNLAHQAALIQQAGPIPPTQFLGLLSSQLGGEPQEAGTLDVATRTWTVYNLAADAGTARVYLHDEDGFTLLVALIAPMSDLDDIEQNIIASVLENLQQG